MPIVLPHAHSVQLGQVHCVSAEHVGAATQSATKAAHWWGRLDWEERAAPFMTEELFAPVVAAYVYDDTGWDDTIRLVDESTAYGLTGAIFGADEDALAQADDALRYTAGNFYINDKPTGPVVGQQPFGGARASGTNDKVGTVWNLIRFASPRAVKRNNRVMRRSDS
jgi:acyl-CoA reductase-like NAD-dependent aldehyde dehydrogenase